MKKFHGISSVHNTGRSHSQITDSKKSPLSASTENNAPGCDSRHLARESCLIVSQPDSSQVFFCVSHCPRFACRYCHIGWTRIAASGHGTPKDAPRKTFVLPLWGKCTGLCPTFQAGKVQDSLCMVIYLWYFKKHCKSKTLWGKLQSSHGRMSQQISMLPGAISKESQSLTESTRSKV